MSQSVVTSALAGSAADTSLHGRWLLSARMGWIVLTLLILTLNAVMIPSYAAVLQAPAIRARRASPSI